MGFTKIACSLAPARQGGPTGLWYMFNLHVIQAEEGDCLILEHGAPSCLRYVLIDGGPDAVYGEHLRPVLEGFGGAKNGLEVVVLSHVDDDHVAGLLDMMEELQQQGKGGGPAAVRVGELWHNTFSQTLGPDVEMRFQRLVEGFAMTRAVMGHTARAGRSIRQGDELTRSAGRLNIPVNPRFGRQRLLCSDEVLDPIRLGELSLSVVGPTRRNLDRLRRKWQKWLEKNEKQILTRDPREIERAARKADSSVPNLSSIMLLAQVHDKRILLTGDGRGDHLLEGLAQAGLLDSQGTLHVEILKVPHHGSSRNTTPAFYQTVTADAYVISANGKHDNPDLDVLMWIVDAAKAQQRSIELYITNATDSTRTLLEERDPEEFGYSLSVMAPGEHSMVLQLA